MKILLTNDDSIHSQALRELAVHLAKTHTVTVVAPKSEMSGISHSFTLFSPLSIEPVMFSGVTAFSVNGTPSDCVKIGLKKILTENPDLIISGINRGENSGISAFYSGTVAGAREGVFFGIRSIALSLTHTSPEHLAYAFAWLNTFLKKIESREIHFNPSSTYLNINFPGCPVADIKGTKLTRMGVSPFRDDYDERVNPSGQKYYWIFGDRPIAHNPELDEKALDTGFVAVTPLTVDMTDTRFFEQHFENQNLFS